MIRRRFRSCWYYIQERRWYGWKTVHRTTIEDKHEEAWQFMLKSGLREQKIFDR